MKSNLIRRGIMTFSRCLLPKHSGDEAQAYLASLIDRGEPLMVARFGAVEIKAMLYSLLPWPLGRAFKKWAYHDMRMNAGFFPVNEESLDRFARLMLESMDSLDVLASWRIEEFCFKRRLKRAYKMPLGVIGGPSLPPPLAGINHL